MRRTNKVLVVLVVLVVRTNFRCVDNNTLIKLCQAFSVFLLTFLFLCVTILYYFIASRVLMNNTNTTKITVFITVALKKALPKILGMPYFISISAYSYLSSVFIVGKSSTSRIAALSVRSITSLSIPYPIPPVGGIPTSRAFKKSSSVWFASSSPAANAAS